MSQHIAVVGLGQMGRSALAILLDALPGARFLAVDRDERAVSTAVHQAPDRVKGRASDVTAGLDLTGVDLVLNLAGPFFTGSDVVARQALATGAAYVDICDDIEGTTAILALDAEARSVGVPLVTGAGLSPGVSNWMACRLLDEHPEADGIQVAWAVHESDPGGLAPLRHMLHMTVSPCPVLRDGVWGHSAGFVPDTAAAFRFPHPLGEIEAYDTAHPEPVTLARHFRRLRNAGCKGALQPAWANSAFSTLGRIGFGHSDVPVEIAGAAVEPAEFLWKLMWARYHRRPQRPRSAHTGVLVQALRGDEVIDALAVTDSEVMARGTGIGAAVAVVGLLKHGAHPGAWGVEVLPWRDSLDRFENIAAQRGGFTDGVARTALSAPSCSA
ncbi:saccharopine dehydrogenase family protein [Streptomyces cacaoi]|uniref:saccharopine dehydrogenase family protein n=1 Tax=Streptomyces cacaoi TaxID=1898 RepID=UPI003747F658